MRRDLLYLPVTKQHISINFSKAHEVWLDVYVGS